MKSVLWKINYNALWFGVLLFPSVNWWDHELPYGSLAEAASSRASGETSDGDAYDGTSRTSSSDGDTNNWSNSHRSALYGRIQPATPGNKEFFEEKFRQIRSMPEKRDRYLAYVIAIGSGVVQPNFTETGWALTRAPSYILEELQRELQYGLTSLSSRGLAREQTSLAKNMGLWFDNERYPPLFHRIVPPIANRILRDLQPLHEEWIGRVHDDEQLLVPAVAYGLRLYQNRSTLYMHIDSPDTHVISSILHVGSSDDADPWPLVLQDLKGRTVEILMTPGDMVLYESSKLLHGRPRPFHGSWYTSLFLHYYPTSFNHGGRPGQRHGRQREWGPGANRIQRFYDEVPLDHHIPPDNKTEDVLRPALNLYGMGLFEPTCKDNWCGGNAADGLRLRVDGPFQGGALRTDEAASMRPFRGSEGESENDEL